MFERDKHDEEIIADIVAGECAINSLEVKVQEMAAALEDAKALGAGYLMLTEVRECWGVEWSVVEGRGGEGSVV